MSEHSFPLQQIYFYITQGCNLSCRHCWISPGNETSGSQKAVLSVSAFEKVIEEAKPLGLKSVKITGGEPLLNTNIIDMLNIVSRERLGLVLETNATLCRPEHVTAIKSACQKPFVTVSLDGADATTHDYIRGVPGSYDSALRGIAYLVNEGIKPQIIFTVMRHNQHQVDLMPRLAEALGAGSLKFNVVQPSQRGQKLHQEHETLSIEELVALGRRVETAISPNAEIATFFDHPAAFRSMRKIASAKSPNVCGIKRIIGVLATGDYAICGIGASVRELTFGRVGVDSLADIWHGHPVLAALRNDLPSGLTGVCSECVMKKMCVGHCVAQNYYRSHNLFSPFWYCEEAKAAGLFPDSRLINGWTSA